MEATPTRPAGRPDSAAVAQPRAGPCPTLTLAAVRPVAASCSSFVYPGLSWNRDEPVYLWHVEVLRAGQLSTTDGGHPDLFQPWLSAARDGDAVLPVHAGLAAGRCSSARSSGSTRPRRGRRRRAGRRRHLDARARSCSATGWSHGRRRLHAGVADPRRAERRAPELPLHARPRACSSSPRCASGVRHRPARAPRGGGRARSAGSSSPARTTPSCGGPRRRSRSSWSTARELPPSAPGGRGPRSGPSPSWRSRCCSTATSPAAPPSSRSPWLTRSTSSASATRRLMPGFDKIAYGGAWPWRARAATPSGCRSSWSARTSGPWWPPPRAWAHRRRIERRLAPRGAGAGLPGGLLRVLRHPHLIVHGPAERADLLHPRLRSGSVRADGAGRGPAGPTATRPGARPW